VFDAPASTLRLLTTLKILHDRFVQDEMNSESSWRVERAFLPSLGLSNKATADEEQESAKYAGPTNDDEFVNSLDTVNDKQNVLKLPSERDLGVTTLWPETRKLFGHDSELVCLDSYRASGPNHTTLVASSCKARNDVASAAIRIWNAKDGQCVCMLKVRPGYIFLDTVMRRSDYQLIANGFCC
jgi:elongator complex protein 2